MVDKRSQSAMEYLVTYGWMFLILAIVVGILFFYGAFNQQSPKARPGSCYVIRPNGPGTIQFMSLGGTCTDQQPEYVANFSGSGGITINNAKTINPNYITISFWVNPSGSESGEEEFIDSRSGTGGYNVRTGGPFPADIAFVLRNSVGTEFFDVYPNGQANVWSNIVATWNGFTQQLYVNGVPVANSVQSIDSIGGTTAPLMIGDLVGGGTQYAFHGQMANFQIYNTSLPQSDIAALYREGIGGTPVDLIRLAAWWPLNGNAKDYSGDNNNGNINGVTFSSSWTSGYTAP